MRIACVVAWLLWLAGAPSAAAQSCWPVEVRVEVRDSAGRRVDAASLDSITVWPVDGSGEPETHRARPLSRGTARPFIRAVSGCRLRVGRVTFYDGRHTMHLEFGMVLDSSRRRGPSTFLIQAPPLRSGTFHLCWDPMEPGGTGEKPQRLADDRWELVAPG